MTLRRYSNTSPRVALTAGVAPGATSLPVASTVGYPAPPFTLAIARGTATEEVCLCVAMGATSFAVERGYDGTTAAAHPSGATIEHTIEAIDFREANAHVTDPAGLDHADLHDHAIDPAGGSHTQLLNRSFFTGTGDLLYSTGPSAVGRLPASTNGRILSLVGGLPAWIPLPPQSKTVREQFTWFFPGYFSTGPTVLLPIHIEVRPGSSILLVGFRASMLAVGGLAACSLAIKRHNPTTSTLEYVLVSGAVGYGGDPALNESAPIPLLSYDEIRPVITSVSNNPANLSVTVYYDVTVA